MKIFILVIYVLYIIIIPQLIGWFLRRYNDDGDSVAVFFIGLVSLVVFTFGVIYWEIITITI